MLEENSDEEIKLIRKCERETDLLNSLNISDDKDISIECNQSALFVHSSPIRNTKSLEFPVVKKWKSPRCNSRRKRKFEDSDFLYDYDWYFLEREAKLNTFEEKSCTSVYGSINGIEVGDWWHSRIECSSIGVHNPTVEGVHAGEEGAYSVSVSGFFEDDQDHGYFFVYTDSVGREFQGTKSNRKNLRIAPQIKNQVADGPNKSLIKSVQTKKPIRVIRGFRLNSLYAPKKGYRYDGLYTAEKYWRSRHASGFLIYKFLMKRCDNQPPPPWSVKRANLRNQISPIINSKLSLEYGNVTHNSHDFDVNSHRCGGSIKANTKNVDRSTSVKIISCKAKAFQCQHAKAIASTSRSQNVSVRNEENKENTIHICAKWTQRVSCVGSRCNVTVSLPNIDNEIRCRPPPACKRTSVDSARNDHKTVEAIERTRKMWLKRMFPKLYPKTRRKKNILSHRSKYSIKKIKECEKFRGFSGEQCSSKMILLGFLIHKLENKLRGQ